MSQEAHPNFRVNVYGNNPTSVSDIERDMLFGAPRGGTGGLPWFRNNKPSPTYPSNASSQPPPQEPPADPGADYGPPTPGMFAGMSGRDIAALVAALGSLAGGAFSKKPDLSANTMTNDPQLQELLRMMSGRLQKSEPLFESVQAMGMGLLPTQYQRGGGPQGGM